MTLFNVTKEKNETIANIKHQMVFCIYYILTPINIAADGRIHKHSRRDQ